MNQSELLDDLEKAFSNSQEMKAALAELRSSGLELPPDVLKTFHATLVRFIASADQLDANQEEKRQEVAEAVRAHGSVAFQERMTQVFETYLADNDRAQAEYMRSLARAILGMVESLKREKESGDESDRQARG